jgi:hypothetical protein
LTTRPSIRELAGRERDEPADQVEGRRLAAARRAEQAEELARVDAERDAIERDGVAVLLGDVDELDRGVRRCRSSAARPSPGDGRRARFVATRAGGVWLRCGRALTDRRGRPGRPATQPAAVLDRRQQHLDRPPPEVDRRHIDGREARP